MVKFTKEFIIAEMQKSYEKNGFAPRCINNDLPFSKSVVRNRGMTWTAALEAAGIPLTVHPARLVNCIVCGIEFDKPVCQMRKSVNNFCSHKCACTHRNTGRVVSNETRKKYLKRFVLSIHFIIHALYVKIFIVIEGAKHVLVSVEPYLELKLLSMFNYK